MYSRISRVYLRVLTSLAVISFAAFGIAAQDPDPNSPSPILLSESDSTRALAQTAGKVRGKADLAKARGQAFPLDEKVELFVTNLSLMEDEGADAFRVYAVDRSGHQFRFPVLAIEPVAATAGVYRVTITLTDQVGYWEPPAADGDVLVYLTWRGMGSNRVRLGLGKIGGDIKEAAGARPTPLGTTAVKGKDAGRPDAPDYVGYRWSGDRLRFLEQAAFGPNLALDNQIRRIGLRTWLNEQFDAQYPSVSNPYPNQVLKPSNVATDCDNNTMVPDVPVTCFRDSYTMYQPQTWFFREAYYGDAQLKHRVAWALAQIWVTSGNDIQQGRHIVEYHKVLSNNAFGNYRNLMKQMTLNPTMGEYLNMRESTRTNPNENYAREIMQLFTIGLFMLNQDGTLQGSPGSPIPTYDQEGVNNLTKVLTGWSFCSVLASCPNIVANTVNYIDPLQINLGITTGAANRHDISSKTLLVYPGSAATSNISACPTTGAGSCGLTCPTTGNCTLTAGVTNAQALAGVQTYANNSMDQAIDNIFNHPNVGPFVGKILIQHLVTSDPTPAYVSRVASKFNNNGVGVRGDMKAVIKAILLDPEARGDVKTDPNFGKLREPVQFATNIFRTFNVRAASGTGQTDGYIAFAGGGGNGGRSSEFNGMAQVPFFSPTVFNYFPPDYGVPGTGMIGPEFAIMTTGTAIQRANFVNRFVFNAIPIAVDANTPAGLSLDFADLQALSTADATGNQLIEELNRRMLHSTMSDSMKATIRTAVTSIAATDPLGRTRQAIYLVATSSQYQVQR